MDVFQSSMDVRTKKLYDFIRVTDEIQSAVDKSNVKNGIVFANVGHTTAAIIMQENDSTIHRDLIRKLEDVFPMDEKYEHDYEGNENATAHLKASLLGSSVRVPIKDGKLQLGRWQDILFVELFEGRNRKVFLTVIGET